MSELPREIGKYELVRKLASGGMAEVYLARAAGPAGFQKTLVVKRILPHLAEDPKFVEMFLAEARLAAQLNHPNVVQIFDFGEADDAYYLAMEHIDGPDLGSLWRAARGRLPIAHAVKIAAHAAEGLDYAHEFKDPETGRALGIVHRDVSPDNILLARTGAVKVTDFGVAKAATSSEKTRAGTLKGKFAYMAPEQLRGKAIDRRADVYSLGATLYEALAGNRLFNIEAGNEAALLNAVAFEPHVPIRERRGEVPQKLSDLLDQALEKDPARRFPSCRAFGAELEGFLRAHNAVVGTYELSSLVADLADKIAGPWNSQNASRSGPKGAAEGRAVTKENPARKAGSGAHPAPARRDSPPPAPRAASPKAAVAPALSPEPATKQARPSAMAPPLKAVPERRSTPNDLRVSRANRAERASTSSELAERLKDLARFDALKEWTAAMKDPAQRRAAIAHARAFPRQHPLETVIGAACAVLLVITLWIFGSALFASLGHKTDLAYAYFEVECDPQAKIRVNGEERGKTPSRVEVSPGQVKVEVYDETLGFKKAQEFTAYLGNNPTKKFEIGHGTYDIRVFPKGTVYLDGRKLGDTPLDPTVVYEGKHVVRIVNPDFKDEIAFELEAKPGEKQTINKSFLKL